MGWSCRHDAGETMRAFNELCREQTQSSNVYVHRGVKYFLEFSNVEHRDGAITGSVYKMLPDDRCRKTSGFRIEPDGTVERGPAILKQAAKASGMAGRAAMRATYRGF